MSDWYLCLSSDWNLEEEKQELSVDAIVAASSSQPSPEPLTLPRPSPDLPVAMETDEERDPLRASHSPLSTSVCSDSSHVTLAAEGLAPHLRFLCESHAHLGKLGWCCRDSGMFLLESVSTLRRELQLLTGLPPKQREVCQTSHTSLSLLISLSRLLHPNLSI